MPFLDLAGRVSEIRERIVAATARGGHGQQVTIVAVTKTHGADAVKAAFDAGIVDVGENRVQEALRKMPEVTVPVRWHLIGHLQRNKVKALDRFALLHSLDSARLADAVAGVGASTGTPVPVLVQVNVSGEESKGGFEPGELEREAERLRGLDGLTVEGAMTIAPEGATERELRSVFARTREACATLVAAGHPARELSMGMSGDFEIAVEEGATMVRLGTILFGARDA
jgi:pyridoxal phosphate enzyme (YggS family)